MPCSDRCKINFDVSETTLKYRFCVNLMREKVLILIVELIKLLLSYNEVLVAIKVLYH